MRFFALVSAIVVASVCSSPSHAVDAYTRQYSDIQTFIRETEAAAPHLVKRIELGENDTGQMIEGVAIGTGPAHHLLVSTHHGNEYGSTEVALAAISHFAESPIPGVTVYIVPVLNVPGYNARRRAENGRDPNRDYPGPCSAEERFILKSTKALADLVERERIVASATLHTFSPAVTYPWGLPTRDVGTDYDATFSGLAKAATMESRYETGSTTLLVYPVDGAYEDWAFWKHGVWSLLFELGYSHSPNQVDLDALIRLNVPGIRRFFEQAPTLAAERHAFTGRCDVRLNALDRHDE